MDRDARTIELVSNILGELDEIVLSAETAPQALDIFSDEPVDLVLLDLELADDSSQLVERMRERSGALVPLVLMGEHLDRDRRLRAARTGAEGLIEKPIDRELLSTQVQSLLERRTFSKKLEAQPSPAHRDEEELTDFLVHDLKNPLAVVQANLEFLKGVSLERDPDAIEALDDAREASTRIQHLVEDILLVSKLEKASFPIDTRELALLPMFLNVKRANQREAGRKNISIEIFISDEQVLCRADPILVRRLIENLVENALRHTPRDGRIALDVKLSETLDIYVGNSGSPVPLEDRPYIFDKYGPGREKGRASGNVGLGLYFCQRAALAHGGSVEVQQSDTWPMLFVLHLPH